ncbi:hypothetical protein REPUB_Repub19eG0067900 [Reevesia pubescens]
MEGGEMLAATCRSYGAVVARVQPRYWDLVWNSSGTSGTAGTFDVIKGKSFNVIVENEDQVEVSFTRIWDASQEGKLVPLNIDKRFIMLRGCSGFFSYAIYEHLKDWRGFNLAETRIAFKLRKDKFHYMAMADNRQRYMPLPDDRLPGRGQALAYPEAVLLVDPMEPELKGEVDDKYQYSCDNKDSQVHGWICTDQPGVGFWMITPSNEFRSGGPVKQNLTSHVGPTTLAVFLSAHYSGEDLVPKFIAGEAWKKVFGPVFIYLNSAMQEDDPLSLWEDAKEQMITEVQSWPYTFPASEDFPKSDQRGAVSGRLLVKDRYVDDDSIPANGAYIGLAPPGNVGSWQRECKDYQFWTKTDENGYFLINDIRTDDYNLYAWVPGFIGDYRYDVPITITPGSDIDVGELIYEAPRNGPTLWEIGQPDRSAAEFYVPDPNPKYINKLYVNHPDRFRQYGLWERYAELYPNDDLVYTVGSSDYKKDWFFAQVTRKTDNNKYQGTTWKIKFKLDNVDQSNSYKLRVAIASATLSELQVRINDSKANALFSSGLFGRDNSIARHRIHGLYWLFNVDIPGKLLVQGDNTIFLTQPRNSGPFQGIMYWDLVWNLAGSKGTKGKFDRIEATSFVVIVENEDQVELSFTRTWDSSLEGKVVPLNIDKRFVMLRNSSGFYTYAIYEHLKEWPAFNLDRFRVAFKLRKDKFHYMAMADNRQRYMPLPDDRLPYRSQTLAYPEAVLLVDPLEPEFKGEVDDKYQYSCENKDNRVHGWICTDPPVGFWQITPSDEFRSAGPLKQNLTSHVGPTTLAVMHSVHYSGEDLLLKFGTNEPWKKVFGPIFIYLNSLSDDGGDPLSLWEDAKEQMTIEVEGWPYTFPASEDFPQSDQRGNVSGRLLVKDRYVCDKNIPANGAYIGLAAPGDVGSWQSEVKGYQFWTRTDEDGYFCINDIRTGDYNLYAWVPGFIGDYRYDVIITPNAGYDIYMGDLVYEPPRDGPTLWEIGIPDRTAAEFYVPDPNPKYINKLYVNHPDRFRQYGLWERYAELYPDGDLVYTVGVSDYTKDWFFAQVTRKKDDNTYQGTTWQIKFKLDCVDENETYILRLALATAHASELQVRVNDPDATSLLFSSGQIGKDNTIARHGIHGLYRLYNVDIPGNLLVEGDNTIFLTQSKSTSPFQGIMYDYIRLEGPASSKENKKP